MIKKKEKQVSETSLNSDQVLQILHEKFGKYSVFRLKNRETRKDIETVSTGSIKLDSITGINGLPLGRVVELYGEESAGKTTLALQVLAQATLQKKKVLFVDTEHALNFKYCENLNIDSNFFFYKQPDTAEEALEFIKIVSEMNLFDVIVLDSVGALISKNEIEQKVGEKNVAVIARLMSKFLPSIVSLLNKNNILLLFINQQRSKLGGNVFFYGENKDTMGGNSLKYFASMRIEIKKRGFIRNKENKVIGHIIYVKIIKNKFSIPLTEAKLNFYFGTGTDKSDEIIEISINRNIIEQSGSWFKMNGKSIARSKEKLISMFKNEPKFQKEILKLNNM